MRQDQYKVCVFREKFNLFKWLNYDIVYMDESGFGYDMPRLFAHSRKGERAIGYRENHNKKRTNLIGGFLNGELIAPMLYDFNTTSTVMHAWIKDILLPELIFKSVIIMDNASFHKCHDIIETIHDSGHLVLYLPPYSPELNPIEKHWAKLKSRVRRFKCNIETLLKNGWDLIPNKLN